VLEGRTAYPDADRSLSDPSCDPCYLRLSLRAVFVAGLRDRRVGIQVRAPTGCKRWAASAPPAHGRWWC